MEDHRDDDAYFGMIYLFILCIVILVVVWGVEENKSIYGPFGVKYFCLFGNINLWMLVLYVYWAIDKKVEMLNSSLTYMLKC